MRTSLVIQSYELSSSIHIRKLLMIMHSNRDYEIERTFPDTYKLISSIKLTNMNLFLFFWEINQKRLYDDIWISIIQRNLIPKTTFFFFNISSFATHFLLRMSVLTTICPFWFPLKRNRMFDQTQEVQDSWVRQSILGYIKWKSLCSKKVK